MPSDWDALRARVDSFGHALGRIRAEMPVLGASGNSSPDVPVIDASADGSLQLLLNTLDGFPTLVGYLQGRRGKADFMSVTSEADVQDLLFISLKPQLPDLVYEEPTKKGAAGYSIGDFSFPSMSLILEVKYVKERKDVKAKAGELAEDVWNYANQTDCQRIIFFVYDPNLVIPDRPAFIKPCSGRHAIAGRRIELQTIIKP